MDPDPCARLGKEMVDRRLRRARRPRQELARTIWREPFAKRTWSEFSSSRSGRSWPASASSSSSSPCPPGLVLAITFFGLVIIALAVRGCPGLRRAPSPARPQSPGRGDRRSRPVRAPSGLLGMAPVGPAGPHGLAVHGLRGHQGPAGGSGVLAGFAFWWDAFFCLTFPIWGGTGNSPAVFGLPRLIFGQAFLSGSQTGFFHGVAIFLTGVVFFFAAPWAVRAVVYLDRRVMRVLLAPDALTVAGPLARAGPGPDRRLLGGDVAADRARPARRHPGPAGGPGHAPRAWPRRSSPRPEHRRPRSGPSSWWTTPTGRQGGHRRVARPGPRHPSAGARHRARGRTGHPGGAEHHPDRAHPLARRTGPRRPSSPSPTSAWPSCWPTWPSTPRRRGPASSARSTAGGCACRARRRHGRGTTVTAGLVVEWVGRPDRPGARRRRTSRASPARRVGPTVVTVDLPLHA